MALTTVRSTGIGSLPAISGANLTSLNASNISSGTLSTSRYVQGGITMAQQWRLTTSFTGSAQPITSNLEADDTYSPGTLGSGMSVSSGVFTFPSTGIYFIEAQGEFYLSGDSRYNQLIIEVTTDNGTYNEAAKSTGGIAQAESSSTHTNSSSFYIFDVTNVSTHKVRFTSSTSSGSVSVYGDTNRNFTCMTFIRLGDT
tara:strand:+ start:507 stop:1103 length:597 start_codon:yes stop_codon:yes gene_type:complete